MTSGEPANPERAIRILIADDEESMRHFVQMGLKRLGHQVVTVPDGAAAIAVWHDAHGTEQAFDVAVLDPPRLGAPGRLAQVCMTRPRRILYVSCHPPSLARDLPEAHAAGYELSELILVDMFPHGPHVELLAVLDPRSGP